jgi:4-amino-4-deoxy-L-arabinose transferase-like glycosyltransferase
MYSWVMFFVTLSFYYAYKITEESNNKNWIIFSFFALFAAYTHYYGALSVGTIYLILLLYSILKNKVLIKKGIFSIIFIILAYLPWVYFTFFNHKSNYFTNDAQFKTPISQDMSNQIINLLFNPIYNTHTID